jgi:hypothetical protein
MSSETFAAIGARSSSSGAADAGPARAGRALGGPGLFAIAKNAGVALALECHITDIFLDSRLNSGACTSRVVGAVEAAARRLRSGSEVWVQMSHGPRTANLAALRAAGATRLENNDDLANVAGLRDRRRREIEARRAAELQED